MQIVQADFVKLLLHTLFYNVQVKTFDVMKIRAV